MYLGENNMYQKKNLKIFILSGKAASGKNVVANIIQEYFKKENCIQVSYAYYIKDYLTRMGKYNESEKSRYRSLLQEFGIDFLSKHIDSHFLIRRVLEDIEVFSYFYDVIIITDARLIDEVEIPKKHFQNVTTIRITNHTKNDLTEMEQKHITEVDLDLYEKFDYVIENNGSLEELQEKVRFLLKGEE